MISGDSDATCLGTRMNVGCRANVIVDGKVVAAALALVVGLLGDQSTTRTIWVGNHLEHEITISQML